MKVKDLIKQFSKAELEKEIVISDDEELNNIFTKLQIADIGNNRLVIYGLTGSEVQNE
jgi:hypothetical protein|tara:strand:+ start:307 stop:480 length:174 start_codon:yes stop_codon:yes gene_type:complete